ncbi:MAG: response regulator [Pseudomonadota bacterium]
MPVCLTIDPSPIVRRVATHLFMTEGFLALDFASAREGILAAREQRPSLILVDSRVEDMGALEAVATLRDQSLIDTKIFITSIENDPLITTQAIRAGANGLIVKPYDRFEIRDRLVGMKNRAA